ncbi:MAG: GcvT family protein [Chloroflexi bacterium]|nr:GcvT family protein [Chloroflexota bacterium]
MNIPSHARVVVIGGGAIGCSVLYHLVKFGWRDVVLLERAELTSGSTWRAAGNTPHYSGSMAMSRVHQYGVALYQMLEQETGQSVGFHKTGSLRLANVPDRMDEYRYHAAKARYLNLPFEIVGVDEIKKLHPLVNTEGILGAVWNPDDGYIDPSMLTNAYAQGARNGGAQIFRHTPVTAICQRLSGEWQVDTAQGSIVAEHVVNAAGVWAREVGFLAGLDLPIVSMQHQYVVFDRIPELVALGYRAPIVREVDVSYYMRQEVDGLLVGPYEKNARTFGAYGIPKDFSAEPLASRHASRVSSGIVRDDLRLPTDIERLQPILQGAMYRVPILANAGIKRVVNGPITYTPDESPLLGPAPGLHNFWLACGFSFGITQSGGSGKLLAEWIMHGSPEFDMLETDPRRFGSYATLPYAIARGVDNYEHEYVIGYPYEEREAGRPARTSALYDRLRERGAFFNTRNGWERAGWFAAPGERAVENYSFRRSNAFSAVAREVARVRSAVGVLDMTSFSKYLVTGRDAAAVLDRLIANRLPRRDGGIVLAHALNERGGVLAEMTITRLAADRFFIASAAAAERRDFDMLTQAVQPQEDVGVENLTPVWGALSIAGPHARELLARVTHADLSNAAFPWRSAQWIEIGAARVLALRISYAGELGWELFHPMEVQVGLYERLLNAGADLDAGDYGFRALDAMRLEKGYRTWGSELLAEITPLEAGLEKFIAFDKAGFVGRDALLKQKAQGIQHRIMTLQVDAQDVDCRGNEPVFRAGCLCGITTSGGYGHTLKTGLALAYLDIDDAAMDTELSVELLGNFTNARVIADCPYDPQNLRPRA